MFRVATTVRSGGWIVAGFLSFVASGQEPTSRSSQQPMLNEQQTRLVEKLVEISNAQRPQAIEDQKKLIADIQRMPPVNGSDKRAGEARKQRAEQLRTAKAYLKKLQDKRKPFLPRLGFGLGMVGVPPDQWTVKQVLSDNETLVTYTYWMEVYSRGSTVPHTEAGTSEVYWLRGYPTKALVTGSLIDLSNVVLHVKETVTYATAGGGSNTTFVLDVVDPVVVRAFLHDE